MSITASIKPSTQPRPVTLQWDDFSGGLNADSANYPLTLAENELADVLNYKYIQRGGKIKLRSRDGLTKVSTAGTAGGAITDICGVTPLNGTSYVCVAADKKLKYLSSGSFTNIDNLAEKRGRMCTFNGKLIIADGSLHSWDGNTYASEYDSAIPLIETSSSYSSSNFDPCYSTYPRVGNFFTMPLWGDGANAANVLYITGVDLILDKVGSPTGNANAIIYDVNGSEFLNGTSGNLDVSTLTTSETEYTLSFSGLPLLLPGQQYFIAFVYTGGDSSNYVNVYRTNRKLFSSSFVKKARYSSSLWAITSSQEVAMDVRTGMHPYATFVINKKNRIYCNDSIYTNRLYYSNANDANDFSTVNGGGFLTFDGHYKINGAYVYYDEIYVFVDNPKAVYKLSGDSPEEYTVKLMWQDITAESQDVIQDVGSDLLFKDTRGVISLRTMEKYGDIEKAIISKEKVNDTYVIADWYCMGGYQVPTDSITGKVNNDNQFLLTKLYTQFILVYDQEYGCWTRYEIDLGDDVLISAYGIINGVTYIGFSDGNLYYLDYTKTKDDTLDFDLRAKTPWTDLGTLMEKDARYADSIMVSGSQETYDLELYKNMDENTAAKTINTVSLTKNGAFETPGCGHLNEVNFNFKQIQAKVTNISSGTGPHYLDRIAIETNILSRY